MKRLDLEDLHELERAAVSSVLLNPDVAEARSVLSELKSGMFFNQDCEAAWTALLIMAESGVTFDAVALKHNSNLHEDVVADMMMAAASSQNGRYYAGLVREHWARRTIGERAAIIAKRATDFDDDIGAIMGSAGEIASGGFLPSQSTRDIAEIELKGSPRGIATGLREIDRRIITRGLPCGQISAIGADTGVGKSAIGQQLAAQWGEDLHVAYATFSDLNGEMLKWRWVKQGTGWMSYEGRLDHEAEFMRDYITNHLDLLNIKVYDGTVHGGDVNAFGSWLESLHATWRVDVWIVDYIQMMSDSKCRDSDPEKQCMSVSKKLAPLATRLGGVGIVLSQVDAKGEEFRYTRQLKMDAGFGMILKRDMDATVATCKVVKNRFGSCGEFNLRWNPLYAKFEGVF